MIKSTFKNTIYLWHPDFDFSDEDFDGEEFDEEILPLGTDWEEEEDLNWDEDDDLEI